ncbi:unnamed protein product [Acanthoscelides obtectus]|uniref:C2H2-type domain-containing protein n=1 Tax=Acanthoscelides obtectus TaxID=200917 RepID=A0A9P0NWR2_ACAOB|nr:unnamed protein product [Acanthoscelides obtectus]CAK1625414.1 hypothetical protein AOBTE_LOCUS3150 [Acanthoscelides obtectus]
MLTIYFVSGDKPHSCQLCNKKFALACNLRAHMKTHEGDPQEECIRCRKPFLSGPTKDDFCTKCKTININNNNNTQLDSTAEDSSGNHTEEDSITQGSLG